MKEWQDTDINMEGGGCSPSTPGSPVNNANKFLQANNSTPGGNLYVKKRFGTSPNRTMTNGSIMNVNRNQYYHNEVNGNVPKVGEGDDDKFEVPLPFGFHLDLDFLRVCSEELVSDETMTKLRELKKIKRKQRKTLESLMGIKQEQKNREKRVTSTLPNVSSQKESILKTTPPPRPTSLHTNEEDYSAEFIRDALRESMVDFEEMLDQYKEPDMPDSDLLTPEAYLATLPSSVSPKADEMETTSICSISSDMSTNTLKNIREQMAKSLIKMKEYEKQVEALPVLQVKLSVIKEEKRLLMLKLKAQEARMRRKRGEIYESDGNAPYDSQGTEEEMDTEDEDLESRIARMSNSLKQRRARSESPFGKGGTVHPEEFISMQRKRSTSCGFNSDSSDISPIVGGRKYYTQDSPEFYARRARYSRGNDVYPSTQKEPVASTPKVETKEEETNTDPIPVMKTPPATLPKPKPQTIEKSSNTDPPPKSPPPPRKVNHGTNTLRTRSIPKGCETDIKMNNFVSKEELEAKLQDAIFRTEEEIMGCPMLQKAMQKIEEDAMKGEVEKEEEIEKADMACQVGRENLCPFVISVGVLCKMDDETLNEKARAVNSVQSQTNMKEEVDKVDVSCGLSPIERMSLMKSVGVGDCKIIDEPAEPSKYRDMGICTEKWVEVIKASKQTDTEDFAFKDTESPRCADIPFEPPPDRPLSALRRSSSMSRQSVSPNISRRSSIHSPSVSRKSSSTSTTQTLKVNQKSKGTMTNVEVKDKVPTKDAKTGDDRQTNIPSTSAMRLSLNQFLPEGSPLSTPDFERPPLNLNLCDKCDKDIHKMAEGIISGPLLSPIISPPPADMPWLSKIPRPCSVENLELSKLKSSNSTGNMFGGDRSRNPQMQRSKSNLTQSSTDRRLTLPVTSKTPPPIRRNMGTPPPHPNTPPIRGKHAQSSLAKSPGPSTERRSFIPKFSGSSTPKKSTTPTPRSSTPSSTEIESFIPRMVTPPALRKLFPKSSDGKKGDALANPERKVSRKNTYNKQAAGVNSLDLEKIDEDPKKESIMQKMKSKIADIKGNLSGGETDSDDDVNKTFEEDTDGSRPYPLPGSALFTPIASDRKRSEPSKEMKAALKVLNDSLSRNVTQSNAQVTNAINIVQQEWFKVSSTKQSSPLEVEEYLDSIEDISKELLHRVVNLVDVNGNTALHYSVSHGNFDIVSVLLDSKVADVTTLNKAGYTCIMLISLALIQNDTHKAVVKRLFSIGDVNVRSSQHGQTALMLAVSHGRHDMVQLLVEVGADVNISDEDGSTALMCAAEHGHMEIVKTLMTHPDINVSATDNDGLTALAVAMEAGHRDIGVLLYANMSSSRGASPYSSLRMKRGSSRSSASTPTGSVRSTNTPVPSKK